MRQFDSDSRNMSELVKYIIDDAKKWCIDEYDLKQNRDFWFKYAFLSDDDKKDLNQFYTYWNTYKQSY